MLAAYLELLERGTSPTGACQRLGVSRTAVRQAIEADAAFRARAGEVYAILSEHVLAALFRAAVKGNVTAQSFWLKTHPPPGWGESRESTIVPMTFDDVLTGLTDAELDELADTVGHLLLD